MIKAIPQKALENFQIHTGWEAEWERIEDEDVEGIVRLRGGRQPISLPTKVRSTVPASVLPGLLELKERYGKLLVVAGRISGSMTKDLKDLGIFFLDSAGNAYIETDMVFIWITGKKVEGVYQAKPLFTKTSLQLIFHFLAVEGLVGKTYREISEVTGVSLDTISRTINLLKENRFLIEVSFGNYQLVREEALLKRWIPEFGDRLKPKLLLGRFRFLKEENWEALEFDPNQTQWSGEPGADKLLNILRPEVFTVYTLEEKQALVKKYRLIPDPSGKIEVYRAFWNMDCFPAAQTAPPLLIYADLLLSGVARNVEVAKQLMDVEKETILPTV